MNEKVIEVDIYWEDLSTDKLHELIEAGYNNDNVINGTFTLTTIYISFDED